MILMTDLGHDPDDAIALAYLIEHDKIPNVIILSPGFKEQVEIVSGILKTYDVSATIMISQEKDSGGYHPGKHKVFMSGKSLPTCSLTHPKLNKFVDQEALIIGPAKNLGGKLQCEIMVFQGGYSPNSIKPLDKFLGVDAVQSFNPCGAKQDFNMLLGSEDINTKLYVGKNVCHGYTKAALKEKWEPKNKKMREFWGLLKDEKAMHDVLAAQCFLSPEDYIWEQAKPVWHGSKLSTKITDDNTYTLVGLL